MIYDKGDATRISSAIKHLREKSFTPANGDRPNVANIGILLTDGRGKDPYRTQYEAKYDDKQNDNNNNNNNTGSALLDWLELSARISFYHSRQQFILQEDVRFFYYSVVIIIRMDVFMM